MLAFYSRDIWNHELTKLLIVTRLEKENEFNDGKTNKGTLWKKCIDKMKRVKPELAISPLEARKKFSNLLISYKRIKKRKEKSGRGAIYWQYFEEFDAVYGTRHNIIPPRGLTFDSSSANRYEEENDMVEEVDVSVLDTSNEVVPRRSRKAPDKRKNDDISELLKYLKEEEAKDSHRHEELMKLEREKNELEKEKINCLKELIEIMKN